jgi:hypothetical protein
LGASSIDTATPVSATPITGFSVSGLRLTSKCTPITDPAGSAQQDWQKGPEHRADPICTKGLCQIGDEHWDRQRDYGRRQGHRHAQQWDSDRRQADPDHALRHSGGEENGDYDEESSRRQIDQICHVTLPPELPASRRFVVPEWMEGAVAAYKTATRSI